MSTPLTVITGVNTVAMSDTMLSLQLDCLNAVTVHHSIDVEHQTLRRIVSDITGVIEHADIDLEHACVDCAIREDIMPTLERLSSDGRWSAIIAQLPCAADAKQICRILSYDEPLGNQLHVSCVIVAIDGPNARRDLVGDELLAERGLQTSVDDTRAVSEVNAALVEYADCAVVIDDIDSMSLDLLSALVRPAVAINLDHLTLGTSQLLKQRRRYDVAEAWVDPASTSLIGLREIGAAWTVELRSDRPFHPQRLLENIPILGGGERRSRGCFWLPTRPFSTCMWDGAGGQLSVGTCEHGDRTSPHTRILVTGIDTDRAELQAVFEHCLLSNAEIAQRGTYWQATVDGYEPWLGPIQLAA